MEKKVKSINERLIELRNFFDLSQNKFAEFIGFSRSHVNEIESGKNSPSEHYIDIVVERTNSNKNWIKYGRGKMFKSKFDEPMKIVDKRKINKFDLCMADLACQQICDIYDNLPNKKKIILKAAAEYLQTKQDSLYSISSGCSADHICKDICDMYSLSSYEDKEAFIALVDILKSQDEDTKIAIRQNLRQFRILSKLNSPPTGVSSGSG